MALISVRKTNPVDEYQHVFNFATPVSTAAAGVVNWVNPFPVPVIASVTYVVTSAGTGTINIGTSSDGTGSGTHIFATSTLAVGAYAGASIEYLIQPRGTAGDSIVAQTNEPTVTGAVVVRFRRIE